MAYFVLTYDLVDDYLERRPQYRAEHLKLARESEARGELVIGGAFAEPADRALLVFRCADRSVAERFVASDPYVANGIVKHWELRAWTVVIGGDGG